MQFEQVVLYVPVAKGGTWDYMLHWSKAFKKVKPAIPLVWLSPLNPPTDRSDKFIPLLNDQPNHSSSFARRINFLSRSYRNPLILAKYLKKAPSSAVILNDFEQLTSPFWTKNLVKLQYKHRFGLFLHDPDRDAYPPHQKVSSWCMKRVMEPMELGFYHEILPEKDYYEQEKTTFVNVGHGVYEQHKPHEALLNRLRAFKQESILLASLGNLRIEKNYPLMFKALEKLKGYKLVVAGKVANSEQPLQQWKALGKELEQEGRLLWLDDYLSNEEFAAVIEACDLPVLYYSSSFKSQSGVLFKIAPYRKPLLSSQGEHALAKLVERFTIGWTIPSDNLEELVAFLNRYQDNQTTSDADWDSFLSFSSWEQNVKMVLRSFGDLA